MDALPFTPVELVAIDPARGLRRRWRVIASYDLFGRLVIETQWGRIGRGGQRRMRSFDSEVDARRYVGALTDRRRSSEIPTCRQADM